MTLCLKFIYTKYVWPEFRENFDRADKLPAPPRDFIISNVGARVTNDRAAGRFVRVHGLRRPERLIVQSCRAMAGTTIGVIA